MAEEVGRGAAPDPAPDPALLDAALLDPALLDPALLDSALLASAATGLYATDRSGRILTANPAACRLLGYSPAELSGQLAHELIHARDAAGSWVGSERCPLLAVIETERAAASDEDVFWRADGAALPVWWASAPLVVDGRTLGAVVAFGGARRVPAGGAAAPDAADGEAALAAQLALHDQGMHNERLALLARLGEILAILDVEEGLRRLARLLVGRLADWCVVDQVEQGLVTRLAVAHRDALGYPSHRYVRVLPALSDADTGTLARAVNGGEPLLLTEFPDPDAPGAGPSGELDREQMRLFRELGARSALVVPLVARHQVQGVLTMVRVGQEAPFSERDVALGAEIGRRAGLALDNARLYQLQRRSSLALQRSLLAVLPEPDHLQLVARYLPAGEGSEVGGDWYDAFLLPDGATCLVIGDVVGHDLAAASSMGQLRNLLRGCAFDRQEPPSAILRRVDEMDTGLQVNALATCLLARVEQSAEDKARGQRRLRWSNAGHLPPAVLEPGGTVRLLDVGSDLLLGVDAHTERTDHVTVLEAGSTLLLYTDGLVERPGSSLDHGLARLRRALTNRGGTPLDQLCDELLAAMLPEDHQDDVALIALRLHSEDAPAPK